MEELRRTRHAGQTVIVFYDGQCGFCRTAVKWLQRFDHTHRMQAVPIADPWVDAHYPGLRKEDLMESTHAVTQPGSEVFTGAAAYREIGRVISPRSLGGLLMRTYSLVVSLPGMLLIAELVYQWIARNRYRFNAVFPSLAACDLPARTVTESQP